MTPADTHEELDGRIDRRRMTSKGEIGIDHLINVSLFLPAWSVLVRKIHGDRMRERERKRKEDNILCSLAVQTSGAIILHGNDFVLSGSKGEMWRQKNDSTTAEDR